MERILGSALKLSHWTITDLEIWVENSVFAIQHTGNRKCFRSAFPRAKLILIFTLHIAYENGMVGQRGGGGGGCQNVQKQFNI